MIIALTIMTHISATANEMTAGANLPALPVEVGIELEVEEGDPDDVGEPVATFEMRYTSPEASEETKIRPVSSIAIPTGRKQLPGHTVVSLFANMSRAAVLL
jgi:hypothetical protein